MRFQNLLLFNPERIIWIGLSILGGLLLFVCPFLVHLCQNRTPFVASKGGQMGEKKVVPLNFSLGLSASSFSFPMPDLQGEMTFSLDPPRPDGALHDPQLLVRMKKGAQSKRISLPCRLNFRYAQGERLSFSEGDSDFWLELARAGGNQVEGKVCIHSPLDGNVERGDFRVAVQESPILSAHEFPEGTPFRLLAEARWWGRDLFGEKYGAGPSFERLEIGNSAAPDLLDVKEGEWLVWQDGHWKKASGLEEGKNKPIAHIQSIHHSLMLAGWEADHHIRLNLTPAVGTSLKIRGEDLIGAVRVRSEKQISCTIEKQCFILKIGDWVLKRDGRWKILRKKEEREAFLSGKIIGEVFVLEGIELKQGQKMIQGLFFNSARSQMASLEMPVNSLRKTVKEASAQGDKPIRKGRLK